jgi:hypothetical protein
VEIGENLAGDKDNRGASHRSHNTWKNALEKGK